MSAFRSIEGSGVYIGFRCPICGATKETVLFEEEDRERSMKAYTRCLREEKFALAPKCWCEEKD